MKELLILFKFFNRRQFLIHFCGLKPSGGLNHRLSLKGTNSADKRNKPDSEELIKIVSGLEEFKLKIDESIAALKPLIDETIAAL